MTYVYPSNITPSTTNSNNSGSEWIDAQGNPLKYCPKYKGLIQVSCCPHFCQGKDCK